MQFIRKDRLLGFALKSKHYQQMLEILEEKEFAEWLFENEEHVESLDRLYRIEKWLPQFLNSKGSKPYESLEKMQKDQADLDQTSLLIIGWQIDDDDYDSGDRSRPHYVCACAYCGAWLAFHEVTEDHRVPRVEGGNSLSNLVPACTDCNNEKGRTTDTEYLQKLGASEADLRQWADVLASAAEQRGVYQQMYAQSFSKIRKKNLGLV